MSSEYSKRRNKRIIYAIWGSSFTLFVCYVALNVAFWTNSDDEEDLEKKLSATNIAFHVVKMLIMTILVLYGFFTLRILNNVHQYEKHSSNDRQSQPLIVNALNSKFIIIVLLVTYCVSSLIDGWILFNLVRYNASTFWANMADYGVFCFIKVELFAVLAVAHLDLHLRT